jgi:hypothetical protein
MVKIEKSGHYTQVNKTILARFRWSQLKGGRCSEVFLVPKLLGRDLGWSLLTGGCYSEVVDSTSLTVYKNYQS